MTGARLLETLFGVKDSDPLISANAAGVFEPGCARGLLPPGEARDEGRNQILFEHLAVLTDSNGSGISAGGATCL
jgi:hypothetical protein